MIFSSAAAFTQLKASIKTQAAYLKRDTRTRVRLSSLLIIPLLILHSSPLSSLPPKPEESSPFSLSHPDNSQEDAERILQESSILLLNTAVTSNVDNFPSHSRIKHHKPVPGRVIKQADIPEKNWLPGHRGVDLQAYPGEEIKASAAGIVHFSGIVAGTPLISINHPDGIRTTYEPVLSSLKAGDSVGRGEVIGYLADPSALPHYARRSEHLSWGARRGKQYIDPLTLLERTRVRLYLPPR